MKKGTNTKKRKGSVRIEHPLIVGTLIIQVELSNRHYISQSDLGLYSLIF